MNYIENKDLNLLQTFLLLLEERNLSKAARKLRLTQPALSRALVRLREEFDDPLFVRTAGGMLPTARALELEKPLRDTLERIAALYKRPAAFDPAQAKGTVRIATTDYFEQVIWTELLGNLSRMAPGLKFVTLMTGSELPVQEMRDGTVQMAIAGFFNNLPNGFMRQAIFSDRFLCITRRDHPKSGKGLTLKRFLDMDHLVVSPKGDLEGVIDGELKKRGLSRRVTASVCSFLSSGPLIANSDLMLTAPSKLVHKFSRHLPLQIHEPPLDLDGIDVVQVWHERYHSDPMLIWVRTAIAQACAKSPHQE